MNDIINDIASYSNRPLEDRVRWYSSAAQAYDKARPHYPSELISYVAQLTQLESHSKILEVGCGAWNGYDRFCRIWVFNPLCGAESGFLRLSKKKL